MYARKLFYVYHLFLSSMYFDADHDLAHEFYEETPIKMSDGRVKLVMKRIRHNLMPQVCIAPCVQMVIMVELVCGK